MNQRFSHLIRGAAAAALLAIVPAAFAQGRFSVRRSQPAAQAACQDFRALSQQVLDMAFGGYIGPTFATLGNETLVDAGAPRSPVRPPTTVCGGGMCTEVNAQYLYDFGDGDTLILEVLSGSYEEPPAFGTYRAVNKAVGGTGRFKDATGIVVEFGPFFAWIDDKGEFQSRYNGELVGKICGVAPKAKKDK
jgi:hypothetical protein